MISRIASGGLVSDAAPSRSQAARHRGRLAPLIGHATLAFACAVALAIGAEPATAQCQVGWVTGSGVPGTNGAVHALAALPSGDVMVGGLFTTAGGAAASNIGRYNPSTGAWSPVVSGTDGSVYAMAILPGGDVIVGGSFFTAGGANAIGIARYNPTTGVWGVPPIAPYLTAGSVDTLAILPGGDVLSGGNFWHPGFQVQNIARWDGVRWWDLGGLGTNSAVYALAILPGGDVIAGGLFSTAGGLPASYVARHNLTTGVWSALGSGMNNTVFALAVLPGGDMIMGGAFTTAGGVGANRIARYNPTTGVWSALGSGTNDLVYALAVLPGGDVIAGGSFTTAGGVPANRIARYNPTTGVWSALGTGTNGEVRAFAVLLAGDLVVGGDFTTAGGATANRIARYNFGGLPVVNSQPSPQAVCTSDAAAFSVAAAGVGPFTYAWRKDGVPIGASVNPSAAISTLFLMNAQPGDAGSYDCVVTGACGSVTSNSAALSVNLCCPTDLDDGSNTGTPDGVVDISDLLYLLTRFDAGC